jgi:hypothetical protein
MKLLAAVKEVQRVLNTIEPKPNVLVRGDPLPNGKETFIMIDWVQSRPYGYDKDMETSVQVAIYAPRLAEAAALQETCEAYLTEAGFSGSVTTRAPEETGIIQTWRK